MNTLVAKQLDTVLRHLYINPLERCNLRCKICYTRKTAPILTNDQILTFVERYKKTLLIQSKSISRHCEESSTKQSLKIATSIGLPRVNAQGPRDDKEAHLVDENVKLETITFCGGEVFTLPTYPQLVNRLTHEHIFIQMITNGTIDRLTEFENPNGINLIVSLDGLPDYHDKNRGDGMFEKSTQFLQKAQTLGFHTEVFSIVTRQNYHDIDAFEKYLSQLFKGPMRITYHPRKPPMYLTHHPISNIVGKTDGFDFLTPEEMIEIMKIRNVFPPKDLGCYQIAVASDGKVYGCCEGTVPMGHMDDAIENLINGLRNRLELWEKSETWDTCLGCSQPDFVCGIKDYLTRIHRI